ncbi:hypothetical protein ACOTEY_25935 [Achromobacter xylosoxidans]
MSQVDGPHQDETIPQSGASTAKGEIGENKLKFEITSSTKARTQPVELMDLPLEIWDELLGHLTHPPSRTALAHTSTESFNRRGEAVIFNSEGLDVLSRDDPEGISRGLRPRSLTLKGNFQLADLNRIPSYVEHVDLAGASFVDLRRPKMCPMFFGEKQSQWTNLRSLVLDGLYIPVYFFMQAPKMLLSLQSLSLNHVGMLGESSILDLAQCPNLRSLSLFGTTISANGIQILSSLTQLDALDLRGTGVSREDAEKLCLALPNLKEFKWGNVT